MGDTVSITRIAYYPTRRQAAWLINERQRLDSASWNDLLRDVVNYAMDHSDHE